MDDWHVSGSESDTGTADEGAMDIGGIKINPEKLRDMLQMVEKRKTLGLDAIASIRRKEHKKRRNKKDRQKIQSPGKEEVSETASEIPSTASNVEARDAPRSSMSTFDYFNDDLLVPISTPSSLRRAGAPKRDRKLARLDGIMADLRKEKRVCRYTEQEPWSCDTSGDHPEHPSAWSHAFGNVGSPGDQAATPVESKMVQQLCSPEVPGFDSDEDSDKASPDSEANIKDRVISQIIKVEKLLDAEGLS